MEGNRRGETNCIPMQLPWRLHCMVGIIRRRLHCMVAIQLYSSPS